MSPTSETPRRDDLAETPRLEELLSALRRRLVRQVFLYGAGTVLGVGALWLAFAYLADWGLRVPKPVRVAHGVVLVLLSGFFLWRSLLAPLRRLPTRSGLAILFERAHPDLEELLVSSVQFQEGRAVGEPDLWRRVLAQAEERATHLTTRGVLDEETPRARFLLGSAVAALVGLFLILNPGLAGIFLARMVGGDAIWPQRTHLEIELPGMAAGAFVERSDERIQLRVARGTDIPILVRADGVVPDEVLLHFESARDLVLTASGGGAFRTLLRSCQEDTAFHVTGGDDDDGRPRVEIEVLQPPDVEGVAVRVRPPAYSGLPETLEFDRDVEVLAGSELSVHVLPTPPDATGTVRFLPSDELVELTPHLFPAPEGPTPERNDSETEASAGGEATRTAAGLAFELVATESFGYRVELVDGRGLSNPDPGLFRVQVVEDRPPEIQMLAPGRTELEIVSGGAVPLRAFASDDFGVTSMAWNAARDALDEDPVVLSGEFAIQDVSGTLPAAGRTGWARRAVLGSHRVEVDELGSPERPVAVDDRYVFEVEATDGRRPDPGIGRSLSIRARVVTPEELLRRMQDRLAQARISAIRLSELQREKRLRVEELLDAVTGDGSLRGGEAVAMSAALAGERRVLGDAGALVRELASVAEDILYARLDEKAGGLLAYYEARVADVTDQRFHGAPWRELARAEAAGELGSSGFAGNLVRLVGLALEIGEDHVPAAVRALDEAEKALDASARDRALVRAIELQGRALDRMEALLEELSEWDNFQNILTLTRDILNRQKALRERTQQFAAGK